MSNQQVPQQPQNQPYQYSYAPNDYQQPPVAPAPPKPSKLKRFGIPGGLLLLGLIIGGATGASAVPEPVTVTKEVPVEKIQTVTETPASCLNAIDYAEQIIESSGRAIGVMSEMFRAAANLDAAEIKRLGPDIDAETAIITKIKPQYLSARDACQASR